MTALITTDQIRTLQATRRKAGIDDDGWHVRLGQRYGVSSTKLLTVVQAKAELASLKDSAPARRPDGRLKLSGSYAAKLQALWIAAWNLGIVRERDDAALVAFVRRQTGIDHVRWVQDAEDAAKAIEALKGWMVREAGVDWTDRQDEPRWCRVAGYRVASAQFAIIARIRPVPSLRELVAAIVGKALPDLTQGDWITVMNRLGNEIRKAKGG